MKPITTPNPDSLPIQSLEDLRAATRSLKATIRGQESSLRKQAKALPVESLKAGVHSVFHRKPGGSGGNALGFLSKPLAGLAITAGTAWLGKKLTRKAGAVVAKKAGFGLAKSGLIAIAPIVLKWLLKKKKA